MYKTHIFNNYQFAYSNNKPAGIGMDNQTNYNNGQPPDPRQLSIVCNCTLLSNTQLYKIDLVGSGDLKKNSTLQ